MTLQHLTHMSVLLSEAVQALVTRVDGVYVDGTFGRGGHSNAILQCLSQKGRLLAFDKDQRAIEVALKIEDSRFSIIHQGFSALSAVLQERQIMKVSGILLDLGISSPQVDDPTRGFSFQTDGPLDMRMDVTRGQSAQEWLAQVSFEDLVKVIKDYGEERFAFKIAKAIINRREESVHLGPLCRTGELAEIVARVVKTRETGRHPATRTFQAIRIHINQELQELQVVLQAALDVLEEGGRLVVISFHSLEDRIVKQFMRKHARPAQVDRYLPLRDAELAQPKLQMISRVFPSEQEVLANPRARSAVMRVAQRNAI